MKKLILIILCLTSFNAISQSRSPAVEDEIIIKTEQGTQTRQFLEKANGLDQGTPMNVFTLFTLLTFLSAPFGIYLVIEKQSSKRKNEELNQNVVLMSEYQKHKTQNVDKSLEVSSGDDFDNEDQAA